MLALLCSGQGGQHRDMFALTAEVPAAAPVFEAAAALLGGCDPRRLVRQAETDALFANRTGQILCCTAALAAAAALGEALERPRIIAGYSVGELAAWGVAGVFDAPTTLALAAARAEAMDAATPPDQGLAAIAGLDLTRAHALLASHALEVAIDNGPAGLVAGGPLASLDAAIDAARAAGATTARRLPVALAAHTRALAPASARFEAALLQRLEASPRAAPAAGARLLSTVDATVLRDVRTGARRLAAQISSPILWADGLQACREAGVTVALELGPGQALARMAQSAGLAAECRAIEQFRTPDGPIRWLAARPD